VIVEQVIRPTGLVTPRWKSSREGPGDDLLERDSRARGENERCAGDHAAEAHGGGFVRVFYENWRRCRYLHSEVETWTHQNLRDLRPREFDVAHRINLLREGLDLPQNVAVAILDADKEGFLRSTTSSSRRLELRQAHRGGQLLYADRRTDSMNQALMKRTGVAPSKSRTTKRTTSPDVHY